MVVGVEECDINPPPPPEKLHFDKTLKIVGTICTPVRKSNILCLENSEDTPPPVVLP